jgi:two-component system, chemotaxis family, response regulator Rcp1
MAVIINGGKPVEVLLVEDVPEEAELTMDTLREGRIRNLRVHWVENGEEAMAFLRREGPHADAPRPDLILLDLHMPRMGGLEVLAEVKSHPDLKRIPVVVMTSSSQEKDVLAAYSRHANCYITKPINIDDFMEAVRSIEEFWLSVVRLPAA